MHYHITEPHPAALPNHYVHTGRGGAGNKYMVGSSKASKATPSLTKTSSQTSSTHHSSTSKISTGRGGAGNIHPTSELSVFSFDDEMDAQVGREKNHDVWHVGRGGAGNRTAKAPKGSRKMSNESDESNSSTRSGFFGRVSGVFERH